MHPIVRMLALLLCIGGANSPTVAAGDQHWAELRGVVNADFNQDGSRVITRLRNDSIGIWDVAEGTRVQGDLVADSHSKRYEMSADHRLVIVGFEDAARVFDATSAAAISPMLGAKLREQIRIAAVFAPDGGTVVIFEEEQTSVWRVRSGERITKIPNEAGPAEDSPPSAIFTANGTECFLMSPAGTVVRYETEHWTVVGKRMPHPHFDTAYEFGFSASADGRWIATFDDAGENGPKGQLQIWDATTSKPLGAPLINVNGFDARFLADPPRVLVHPARGDATVRQLPSMKVLYAIKNEGDIAGPSLDLSGDGKWIFAWGADHTLRLLDSADGKVKHTFARQATISGVAVAADSTACFVSYDNSTFLTEGFWDNYVLRLRVPDLKVAGKFRSLGFLTDVSLSPNGQRALLREGGSNDERLLIFNAGDMSAMGGASEEGE